MVTPCVTIYGFRNVLVRKGGRVGVKEIKGVRSFVPLFSFPSALPPLSHNLLGVWFIYIYI